MYTLTANGLEDYKNGILNRLLRLREENPWCWQKMALQVNEPSGAQALSQGSVVHWVEQQSVANNRQN